MARKPKLSPCPDPDPALSKAIRQYRARHDRFWKTILGTTTSPADLSHLTSMDDVSRANSWLDDAEASKEMQDAIRQKLNW